MGAALAGLRDQGVLVMGSGSMTHNLGRLQPPMSHDAEAPWVNGFVAWVNDKLASGDAEGLCAHAGAGGLERGHGRLLLAAVAHLAGTGQLGVELLLAAEQAATRHADVVEHDLGGVARTDAVLLVLLAHRQPGGVGADHEAGLATALQLAQTASFDVVISDIGLPDGSGLDVCRAVRAHATRNTLPILMLSAQGDEIDVHLLDGASLLARAASLDPQPTRQLLGKRVQLARPISNLEPRLYRPAAQILADRIARQPSASLYLPDRHPLTEMPAPDYAQ